MKKLNCNQIKYNTFKIFCGKKLGKLGGRFAYLDYFSSEICNSISNSNNLTHLPLLNGILVDIKNNE